MSLPPPHVDVLIIGGGPAGSYAASALARDGINVAVLESAQFPRYHVGESLIPSVRHYLRFIGAEEKMENHGFQRKPGSAIKFNQFKREGYTDFVALGHNNNAWNVVRSEFDHLLLNHARESGAQVYERTRVTCVNFTPQTSRTLDGINPPLLAEPLFAANGSTDPGKPTSVSWSCTVPYDPSSNENTGGTTTHIGQTSFKYLIDASGRAGLLSTRYLKNRRISRALQNIAVWGYWRGAATYGANNREGEGQRVGAPWFEALTDESGWAWFIPLHDGTTSVGVVLDHKAFTAAKANILREVPSPSSPVTPLTPSFFSPSAKPSTPKRQGNSSPSKEREDAENKEPETPRPSLRTRSSSLANLVSRFTSSIPSTPSTPGSTSPTSRLDAALAFISPFVPLSPLRARTNNMSDDVIASPITPYSPSPYAAFSPGTNGAPSPTPKTPRQGPLKATYLSLLPLAPGLCALLQGAELTTKVASSDTTSPAGYPSPDAAKDTSVGGSGPEIEPETIRTASDFSYSALSYAGGGYRIIGDAGSFIDPFFSSGIHLAMTSALSASASICASLRGECSETDAAAWHTKRVATSYTRFQVVVLSAYKQIRAQKMDVLSDIDEDNYDRAFSFLRPVIQGASDMGTRLSDEELQRSLDFCVALFGPTTPEQHARVAAHPNVSPTLIDVSGPVVDMRRLNLGFSCEENQKTRESEEEKEMQMVLQKINARRVVHAEYTINNMEVEPLEGWSVRLETGRLGLIKTEQTHKG